MSDIDSDDSDDSVFSEESVEDDSAEAKRRIRRAYRPKQYRSLGVLSKEWIAARDAMVRGDAAGFAKTMAMIRKRDRKEEALHGSWGGKTLLHHAASYGCTNSVKLLLHEGANLARVDGKGNSATRLARKNNHDSLALIIEFWDSPTTNHKIEGGPNFDYDPEEATRRHDEQLIKEERSIARTQARQKLKDDELAKTGLNLNEAALAKKLGVIVVQKGPPKNSKQPARPVKRESMGTLENIDDKEGMMSEYQKFRAAEAAAEEEEEAETIEVSLQF
mmetsp:Transcript_30177/g.35608  ORF Transcript_30177/g.35608 Transcript_30177/m.35608 type:complete len:276 (-) Transcript_30177:260-1087(-)|eukprot:CAMPEP_0114340246 /NCGR_PEP_ID=MMETSP0101-20121206/8252_1 /TAXON_ID=38822 ORGANISM="Pteridomonas danica, Strain PT" /NCGR_SAMPLE_ID=MMETSP0101 /ASSEMBLY_ACC=CAM_ASM_000211 /LENGTH=275 /DNA_ID=CAMNT_0001473451 /DNA_START=271 /DNA_END=1098 /DNA_ORIENTATION=-